MILIFPFLKCKIMSMKYIELYFSIFFFEKLIRMAIFMVPIPSNKDPILGT